MNFKEFLNFLGFLGIYPFFILVLGRDHVPVLMLNTVLMYNHYLHVILLQNF